MPRLKSFLVLLLLTPLLLVGCSRGDRPPLARVRGNVTLDGKPLKDAIVNFRPRKGRQGTANVDAQGNFEIYFGHNVPGAAVGTNRVWFEWPTGYQATMTIPESYGAKSELDVEVTSSGPNNFKFEISSKD